MTDEDGPDRDEVRVRRAPKYGAFLSVGGGLGAIVAFLLTATNPVDPEVGFLQMFLFLGLFCVTFGMLLGGIAALAFDRASARRTRTVAAERSEISAPAQPPVAEAESESRPDEASGPLPANAEGGTVTAPQSHDIPPLPRDLPVDPDRRG